MLSHDPIFQSRGRKPQRHIKYQLGCFLVQYGLRGCDSLDTAQKLSIGHGTVFLYCKQVSRALQKLGVRYIKFPNEGHQEVISNSIEEKSGFPRCIGSADGSLIQFTEQPLGEYARGCQHSKETPRVEFFFQQQEVNLPTT